MGWWRDKGKKKTEKTVASLHKQKNKRKATNAEQARWVMTIILCGSQHIWMCVGVRRESASHANHLISISTVCANTLTCAQITHTYEHLLRVCSFKAGGYKWMFPADLEQVMQWKNGNHGICTAIKYLLILSLKFILRFRSNVVKLHPQNSPASRQQVVACGVYSGLIMMEYTCCWIKQAVCVNMPLVKWLMLSLALSVRILIGMQWEDVFFWPMLILINKFQSDSGADICRLLPFECFSFKKITVLIRF